MIILHERSKHGSIASSVQLRLGTRTSPFTSSGRTRIPLLLPGFSNGGPRTSLTLSVLGTSSPIRVFSRRTRSSQYRDGE